MACSQEGDFNLIIHLPNSTSGVEAQEFCIHGGTNNNNDNKLSINSLLIDNNYPLSNNIIESNDNRVKPEVLDFIEQGVEGDTCFSDTNNILELNNCILTKSIVNDVTTIDMNCSNTISSGGVQEYVSSSLPDNMNQLITNGGNNNYAVCDRGYVAEGSYQFNQQDINKDMIYGPAIENSGMYSWTEQGDQFKQWTGECVLQNCPPLSVIDSDREFNVLIGDITTDPYNINCNDGYIFNSGRTISQRGAIYCDYSNNIDGSLTGEMNWYVHNPSMEEYCGKKGSKEECIATPSENDILGDGEYCVWSEQINTLNLHKSDGSTQPLSEPIQGECLYRKPVHLNDEDPICSPRYCGAKIVPKSSRNSQNPLPGPPESRIHGLCLTSSGEEITDAYGGKMNSSADCACQRHRSCKTCTQTPGCEWCGSEDDDIMQGSGPQCFSVLTENRMCDSDVKSNNRGGTCSNVLPGYAGLENPNFDPLVDNADDCNSETCITKNTGEIISPAISEHIQNFSPNSVGTVYDNEDLCIDSWNNVWSSEGVRHIDGECLFINDKIRNLELSSLSINSFGNWQTLNDIDIGNISINENICKPKNLTDYVQIDGGPTSVIQYCNNLSQPSQCSADTYCEWIQNDLSDRTFFWTDSISDRYTDQVKFESSDTGTCNYCVSDSGNYNLLSGLESINGFTCQEVDREELFSVYKNYNNSGILNIRDTESDRPVYVDETSTESCLLRIDPNNQFKVDNNNCNASESGSTTNFNCFGGTSYCEEDNCNAGVPMYNGPDGSKRCEAELGICSDLSQAICLDSSPVDGVIDAEVNCRLMNNGEQVSQQECNQPPINCPNSETEFYTSDQSNEIISDNIDVFTLDSFFKPFMNVDYNTGDENLQIGDTDYTISNQKYMCDRMNSDNVHYGRMCERDGSKIPIKQLCLASNNRWEYNGGYNGEWKCYYNEGSTDFGLTPTLVDYQEIPDEQICSFISTSGVGNSSYNVGDDTCIVEGDDVDTTFGQLTMEYCNSYENYDLRFNYFTNETEVGEGSCTPGNTRPNSTQALELGGIRSKESIEESNSEEECTFDNHLYVQEYEYSHDNTCLDDNFYEEDIDTIWTGGNTTISNSECSSSILSSCYVECDEGYGGGGEYICHYNSEDNVDCSVVTDDESCNNDVYCLWQEPDNPDDPSSVGTCIRDPAVDVNGKLEWQGSECYLLNNDSFAHGIMNLPRLDELFPPLVRVFIVTPIILSIILLILWKLGPRDSYTGKMKGLLQVIPEYIIQYTPTIVISIFNALINIGEELISAVSTIVLNPSVLVNYLVYKPIKIITFIRYNYKILITLVVACISLLIYYALSKQDEDEDERDEDFSFTKLLDTIQDKTNDAYQSMIN